MSENENMKRNIPETTYECVPGEKGIMVSIAEYLTRNIPGTQIVWAKKRSHFGNVTVLVELAENVPFWSEDVSKLAVFVEKLACKQDAYFSICTIENPEQDYGQYLNLEFLK